MRLHAFLCLHIGFVQEASVSENFLIESRNTRKFAVACSSLSLSVRCRSLLSRKTPPPKKLADDNLGKNLFGEFIKGLRGAISEKMKPKAVVESPVSILARRLAAGHTDSVGTHVADFLIFIAFQ